jgi:ubiquitin C
LLHSIRRYLPDVPKDHDDFEFETNELPIAVGKWVVISEDAWDTVIPLVQTVKVVSSACTKANARISAPQTSQSATRVKRRREDSDPYHVHIRTMSGGTSRISCSSFDTVRELKEKVQDQDGTLPEDQRLIYGGKQLDDDRLLANCGIPSGAMIHLVLRQRGGKPVIYLYPPTATRVSTKLSLVPEWEFSAIYPVVHAKATPEGQELEWVVDASPNGTLKEVGTGLEASYLYWEAEYV